MKFPFLKKNKKALGSEEKAISSAPPHLDLKNLFKSKNSLSFLAGSGISMNYPSCLPTGKQFIYELVKNLIPKEVQEKIINLTNIESGNINSNHFLRFEKLIQLLQNFDYNLHVLDFYADCNKSNLMHEILAKFIQSGHTVFTTNFDNLIEIGLEKMKSTKDNISPVIYKNDWENAKLVDFDYIYKLHGSITDYRDCSDSRKSIQATLKQIGQGKEITLLLEKWKSLAFEAKLVSDDLIVVGYSGLDDFDILPTLKTITSKQRIIWIYHDEIDLNDAKIEIIDYKKNSDDRLYNYFFSMYDGSFRLPNSIIEIHVNTSQFLNWLARHYFDFNSEIKSLECSQFILKTPDNLKLTDSQRWYLAGDIFSYYSQKEAKNCIEKSIICAKKEGAKHLEAKSLLLLGRQYESRLHYGNSDKNEENQNWNVAYDCYENARKLFRKGSTDHADSLSNIGFLYEQRASKENEKKNYQDALRYFHKGLEIYINNKDYEGIAKNYNNISTVEYYLENYENAIKYATDAVEIDKKYGYIEKLSTHLLNLGYSYLKNGDDKGIAIIKEAIALNRPIGDPLVSANCLHAVGVYYYSKRNYEEALSYYKEALSYLTDSNHNISIILKESINRLNIFFSHSKNIGLYCSCKTSIYLKNSAYDTCVNLECPIVTSCRCGINLYIQKINNQIKAYKIVEFNKGGMKYDPNALSIKYI
ncbi:MAG: tetratricopeptide repeat protein [Candidatus Marinimicrobia bacterium]|nr:tetratricopeptide repeat protein [Candidatus Neomarinimicrobiota bacterium]